MMEESERESPDELACPSIEVPLASNSSSSSVSSGERKDTIQIHPIISRFSGNTIRPTSPSRTEPSTRPPRGGLVRILSNVSVGSESPTCPICLDPMTPIDHQHPLLCPTRHCHFNLCAICVASLLSSSKDDYELASDGNAHVKIYLNCPSCRADLSSTVRDVLLLRKVDTVLWLTSMKSAPKLNASQERTKKAMEELDVQEAIQQAREREKQFWASYRDRHTETLVDPSESENLEDEDNDEDETTFHQQLSRLETSINQSNIAISPSDEEWGVEADLETGVHNSFRVPADQLMDLGSDKEQTRKAIDPTLFAGLEFCMTHAEKLEVTHWLTSGEAKNLAKCAVLFHELEYYARQGISPAKRQASLNRRASVYEIVDETRKLHDQKKELPACQQPLLTALYSRTPLRQQQLVAERRQLEKTLQEHALLVERYPIPVRMPKCVELELRDPTSRRFPLRFCNDTWDGTVLDAYSKISIAGRDPNWVVTKKKTQHAGVFHVLSLGKYQQHYGNIEMTLEQPSRVLVASVQSEAGRQGTIKGDVVTHIDGKEFNGHVNDLLELLQVKARDGHAKKFQMILNAEDSVAEALKRRATVLE